MTAPIWVNEGMKDLGFHETGNNQGIEKFITQAHCGALGDPWCAIWVNAVLERSGIRGTRSAAAASFRYDPRFVKLGGPALGALSVFWRGSPDSGQGHVGFYMGETATQVLVLGGNESDAVRQQLEPKAKLFGYWWPKAVPLPVIGPFRVSAQEGGAGKVT